MTHDARAIANWFIERANEDGESMTPMRLQKLVYISHGWTLGLTKKPLTHDPVEAWKWGPVFRNIYHEFREFGASRIERLATVVDGSTLESLEIGLDSYDGDHSEIKSILERVWNVYKPFTAGQLSDMTHREGTPWHQMYVAMGNTIRPYTVIPTNIIATHYEKLGNARRATTAG